MKILIFGPPGSGKTTLAKRLSKMHSINHFELDAMFFEFEKGITPFFEKRELAIEKVLTEEKWIIEGMYLDPWLDKVIQKSDHIFILNPPKALSYFRLSKRTFMRILRLERHDRKSNFEVLFYLLNHIRKFQEKKTNFIERINKENKSLLESKWKSNIIKYLKQSNLVRNS